MKMGYTRISRRCYFKCGGPSNPLMSRRFVNGVVMYFHTIKAGD